jgi:hypothetical protein
MNALIAQADAEGITLELGASPLDKKTNLGKLVKFYESLGFKRTGRAINPAGDPEMVRSPQQNQQPNMVATGTQPNVQQQPAIQTEAPAQGQPAQAEGVAQPKVDRAGADLSYGSEFSLAFTEYRSQEEVRRNAEREGKLSEVQRLLKQGSEEELAAVYEEAFASKSGVAARVLPEDGSVSYAGVTTKIDVASQGRYGVGALGRRDFYLFKTKAEAGREILKRKQKSLSKKIHVDPSTALPKFEKLWNQKASQKTPKQPEAEGGRVAPSVAPAAAEATTAQETTDTPINSPSKKDQRKLKSLKLERVSAKGTVEITAADLLSLADEKLDKVADMLRKCGG